MQVVEIGGVSNLFLYLLSKNLHFKHEGELGNRTVSSAGYDGALVAKIPIERVFCKDALDAIPSSIDSVLALQDDHSVVKSEVQGEGVGVNQYG